VVKAYAHNYEGLLFTDSVLVDYNVFSVEKKFIHCNKLRMTIIGILI